MCSLSSPPSMCLDSFVLAQAHVRCPIPLGRRVYGRLTSCSTDNVSSPQLPMVQAYTALLAHSTANPTRLALQDLLVARMRGKIINCGSLKLFYAETWPTPGATICASSIPTSPTHAPDIMEKEPILFWLMCTLFEMPRDTCFPFFFIITRRLSLSNALFCLLL